MLDVAAKLTILADAAKYDASCASSGSVRKAFDGGMGNTTGIGICHSYTPDGRCVSLLKILFTNYCVYDCVFCVNRISSDTPRARFTVAEVINLTLDFYRRNYIEGLFLSSGIIQNPDYTMEQLIAVARGLRREHKFGGYIHLKAMPSASPELIREAGLWADRLSANVELPSQGDLAKLAPEKDLVTIRGTMSGIKAASDESEAERKDRSRILSAPIAPTPTLPLAPPAVAAPQKSSAGVAAGAVTSPVVAPAAKPATKTPRREPIAGFRRDTTPTRRFAPAGQSTQMIVGATPTNDSQILTLASDLYAKHSLRRIYYSAFSPFPKADTRLPIAAPPLVREHRLYEADWLMRYYGFHAAELTTPAAPNLDLRIDPKLGWALRHRETFPININTAPREQLLRVPGIGYRTVQRILSIRRHHRLRLDDLKKLRIYLKRAKLFLITEDHRPDLQSLDSLDLEARFTTPAHATQLDFFNTLATPLDVGA
jgi:putative DNA modification/repair radical SAM protein